jgi:hypothetical protein
MIARVPTLSVARFTNRQRAAGTRRVHHCGHARAPRAGTTGMPGRADLQEKRGRECPAVPAKYRLGTSMARRGSTVRVRQRA